MYRVGDFKVIDKKIYVYVNIQGTVEIHNKIKWYALLYLEILQGINIFLNLIKLREYLKKWKAD